MTAPVKNTTNSTVNDTVNDTGTVNGSVTRHRPRGRSAMSSPFVVAVMLGLLAILIGLIARATITGKFGGFGNDAGTIEEIMSSPFSASDMGYGSYSVIAEFYQALGMEDAPTAAAVFGVIVGSLTLGIVSLE